MSAAVRGVERARAVVRQMLAADGCAWHAEQTHQSLLRYLIEESAEVVSAVETNADPALVAEELGDVLYQVLFHAELAARDAEGYDLDVIGEKLADKLIARHPHVFGDRGYMSTAELEAAWEQLKREAAAAQQDRGVFEGIADAMPTLAKADKMVVRLQRGDAQYADELADFLAAGEQTVGKRLLQIVADAAAQGVDCDAALRQTLRDLTQRVAK